VTPLLTAAVLLAAVTHAGWNAIAHRITDKLVGFTLILPGVSSSDWPWRRSRRSRRPRHGRTCSAPRPSAWCTSSC
jgi:hypothetical protein